MDSTKEAVGKIETRLDQNEKGLTTLGKKLDESDKAVAELGRRLEESDKNMANKIAEEVAKHRPTAASQNTDQRSTRRRDEAYSLCRRSLKLWPVNGEDLEDAVRVFLGTRLGLTSERIVQLGSIVVSLPPSKAARDRNEVIAAFETREDRDFVKSNGAKLGGQRVAGMSLHVPGHLLDNLATLNGLAYSIKQKNNSIKRAVKFDDSIQDIYLDICIAGNWRKVTPNEARQALKEVPTTGLSTGSLSVSDLTSLIQGKEVPGLTVTVIPEETMDE